jgi:hypothetical protein|tara:strand:+ start:631 stop:1044 length:414 start_codon:yes stop_codon:yes gene_type:complete
MYQYSEGVLPDYKRAYIRDLKFIILAVGAPTEDNSSNTKIDAGAVYVFNRAAASWTQKTMLTASIPEQFDNFGYSLSLSDDGPHWQLVRLEKTVNLQPLITQVTFTSLMDRVQYGPRMPSSGLIMWVKVMVLERASA